MTRTMPKGIFKRGRLYSVRYSVPTEFQLIVGRKEIVRSLGTPDLGEAIAKSKETLEEIRAELFSADQATKTPAPRSAQKPSFIASRQMETTVRETAHRWLSDSDGITNSTRQRYRRILERFATFTGNPEVSTINREMALAYMDHLKSTPSKRTGHPLSHRSLGTHQICLASYWRVLEHWGLVDGDMKNPFSSLLRRLAGQRKKADPRAKNLRPVTREEAEALLAHITSHDNFKYQREMIVIVKLLWVTACRLGEIAGLALSDIDDLGDHMRLTIKNAKTEAGNRVVMIVGQSDCEVLRGAMRRAEISEPVCPENKGLLFPRLHRADMT